MWEMRIVQLAFEQRAPTGCLQYFQGLNGTLRTLNYLSNGRFLASQDYLVCIRQERRMCGVAYAPCTPESFRIGPRRIQTINANGTSANMSPNAQNANLAAQSVTNSAASVNNTEVNIEGSGTNPTDQDGISNVMDLGQERCRDRVLIPCDFEEFITVLFLIYFWQDWKDLRRPAGMGWLVLIGTCLYFG